MPFILTLTALVALFGMWLTFALLTVHSDPEKAEEWFPFRRRREAHRLPGRDDER